MSNKIKQKKMKKRWKISALVLGILAVIGVVSYVGLQNFLKWKAPELSGEPKVGEWYRITPEGTKSANGKDWHSLIKVGKENKVIVYFFGGGLAVDEYTAARPLNDDGGFYADYADVDFSVKFGIASNNKENPFKDWTILAIPYSTGDLHAGSGEYEYTDLNGNKQILYHNGYINYTSFMKKAMKYIPNPDTLLIAGFSAGGFGTSLLADDIITQYFPQVNNVTVAVDSSLLLTDTWHDVAEHMWQTPKEISDRLVSDNIILDSLTSLSKKYGNKLKILFGSSLRDEALSTYQSYFRNGILSTTNENGDIYEKDLVKMVADLQDNLPNVGIYIWNEIEKNKDGKNLTPHTILPSPNFYGKKYSEDKSIADWIINAINGNINSYGLDLLDK
ncbi:pectin acetylesterase-family hydrolase [Paenibacillus sp. FSL K6-2393]|uniref:pectin acetylesterase-family hydrolase n=1 Tax=Paenibacillus sp. FSL K6-2393 TaxID=2921475 RepID=UPI0030F846B1